MTAFHKMHGLGNDFVVFDARNRGFSLGEAAARAIADRHVGVGCDQVIVIENARTAGDAFMRIFNADGDEVEACGNAARCVGRLLLAEKGETLVQIDTLGGLLACSSAGAGAVTVDMGPPRLSWKDIPLARAVDTRAFSLSANGQEFTAAAVSMGNPHCVIFTEDAERVRLMELGPLIEKDPLFPARTNVEFASVSGAGRLRVRVWERGAGPTRACGTGACATVVAANRRGLGPRMSEVILDGGALSIEWRETNDHVLMTGPASLAFSGEIDLSKLETPP
jgi:diaminopimelate epimerase